ncbi:uncharacterized protein [Dermacentor albipictus]|uniref:uncharacterized protein n=1 Tax=Dermacentor albipictus TaxID=60249 RepID=UPI0038FC256F
MPVYDHGTHYSRHGEFYNLQIPVLERNGEVFCSDFDSKRWFFTTHDANYSVTFSEDAEALECLSMTMEPITPGTGNSTTYKFQYWNETEKCFVLTSTVNETETRCELNAWDSVASEKANISACQAAYKLQCPTPEPPYQVFTENCRVTALNFNISSMAHNDVMAYMLTHLAPGLGRSVSIVEADADGSVAAAISVFWYLVHPLSTSGSCGA